MKKYRILKADQVKIGVNSLGGMVVTASQLTEAGHTVAELLAAGAIEVYEKETTKPEPLKESPTS